MCTAWQLDLLRQNDQRLAVASTLISMGALIVFLVAFGFYLTDIVCPEGAKYYAKNACIYPNNNTLTPMLHSDAFYSTYTPLLIWCGVVVGIMVVINFVYSGCIRKANVKHEEACSAMQPINGGGAVA